MAAIRIKRKQPVRREPEEEQYEEVVEEEIVEEVVEEEPVEEYEEEVVEEAVVEEEPEEEEPELEPEEIAPVKRPATRPKSSPKAKPKSSLKSRVGKLSTEGGSSSSSGKGLSAGDKQAIIRDYKAATEKYKSARSKRNKLRPKFVRFVRSLTFLLRWTVKLCGFAALLLCIYLVLQKPIRRAAKSESKGAPAEFARALYSGVTDKVLAVNDEARTGYLGWLIWAEDEQPIESSESEEPPAGTEGIVAPVVDEGLADKISELEAEIARLKESPAASDSTDLSEALESLKEYTRQNRELVERLEALTGSLEKKPADSGPALNAPAPAATTVIEEVQPAPVKKATAVKDTSSMDQTRRLLGR